MEIKEIDGKKFIEYDQMKAQRRRLIMSIAFLILLAIVVVVMLLAIATLIKNKDIIASDPLRYGMDVHGFNSCQCTDDQGQIWQSYETGFINEHQGPGFINYSKYILNQSVIDSMIGFEVIDNGTS